jgi:subtilisin family serine protease
MFMLFVYGKRKNGHKEGVKRVKRIEVLLALMIGMVCAISQVQAAVVTSIPLPELGLNAFLAPNQVVPNDPYWDRQWYLRQIGADRAWTVTTGTKQIIVAIIDAGVDVAHPDIRENIWINTREQAGDGIDNDANGFVDDIQGWNFVTNAADVRPLTKSSQREEAWSHRTMKTWNRWKTRTERRRTLG